MNREYPVTPYAKKYGIHPNFFHYNRRGEMELNDEGIAEEMRQQELKELRITGEDIRGDIGDRQR